MNQSGLIKLVICCIAALLLAGCVWEGYDGNRGENRHEHDRGDQHDNEHRDHEGDR